jgi:hypothetical protein
LALDDSTKLQKQKLGGDGAKPPVRSDCERAGHPNPVGLSKWNFKRNTEACFQLNPFRPGAGRRGGRQEARIGAGANPRISAN